MQASTGCSSHSRLFSSPARSPSNSPALAPPANRRDWTSANSPQLKAIPAGEFRQKRHIHFPVLIVKKDRRAVVAATGNMVRNPGTDTRANRAIDRNFQPCGKQLKGNFIGSGNHCVSRALNSQFSYFFSGYGILSLNPSSTWSFFHSGPCNIPALSTVVLCTTLPSLSLSNTTPGEDLYPPQ